MAKHRSWMTSSSSRKRRRHTRSLMGVSGGCMLRTSTSCVSRKEERRNHQKCMHGVFAFTALGLAEGFTPSPPVEARPLTASSSKICLKHRAGVTFQKGSLSRRCGSVAPGRAARLLDADGRSLTKAYPRSKIRSGGGIGKPHRPPRPKIVFPLEHEHEVEQRAHETASLEHTQKALARDIKCRGERRDWEGALTALRAAPAPPSLRCYNAAMSAMATSGRWQEALLLLSDLRSRGLVPNGHTYSAAMKACGSAHRVEDALALLETMRREAEGGGAHPDSVCFNVCISACVKSGLSERALSLLGEMRAEGVMPDVVSFNSIINGLGMAGRWEEALAVMEDMMMVGVAPNSITYASAINACGQSRQLARALDLLREARVASIDVGTSAYNAAIAACGHAGCAKEAFPLLAEMKDRGVPRTVITYSSMINVCGKGGLPDAALDLMRQMKGEGIEPNAITYNALIHAAAGGGVPEQGDASVAPPSSYADGTKGELFERVLPPVPSLAVRTSGSRRGQRRWEWVVPLMEEMQAAGHSPDLLSYNLALAACAMKGEATKTLRLLGDMRRAGLLPTSVSYGTAVASCERAGNVEQALSVLSRIKARGVRRNLVAFNTAMLACAKHGKRAEAVELLNEMKAEGVQPDEKSFRLAIQACGRAGDAPGALVLLRGMAKAGIQPGEHAFASAMEPFAQKGDVDQVMALIQEARASAAGSWPHWSCISTGAKACAAAGRASDAIRLLQELRPQEYRRWGASGVWRRGTHARSRVRDRAHHVWREVLWAAANEGQTTATVQLFSAARRQGGQNLTIAHYNKALRMLAGHDREGTRGGLVA